MKAFLNGRLIPLEKAVVPVTDRGFLFGDGAYETVRVYAGRPFLLPDHLRRLNDALHVLRIVLPSSLMDLGRAVQRLVSANKLRDGLARITVTRGSGPRGFGTAGCDKPTLVITTLPLKSQKRGDRRPGVTAAVVSVRRLSPKAVPPGIKSNNCLNQIFARLEAADLGADDAILLTEKGLVAEASSSNVFIVTQGVITTPPADGHILPGVTRNWLIRLAREAGYTVREKTVTVGALAAADEIFLTNAVAEVTPVSTLLLTSPRSRRTLRPGPVTADLIRRFVGSH